MMKNTEEYRTMSKNALSLINVTKNYKDFTLDKVNFNVPRGSVMGFIGENGAGKSTTIKLILGMLQADGGSVSVFGKPLSNEAKEDIGVVLDECSFPTVLTAKEISNVMKNIYKNWDVKTFKSYLKKFELPRDKKVKDYSKGMKMKLSIAAALSHNPKLLILDEATSGLDPVVRDEILDVFLDFMQDESHSILISSHIVTDLEKICDYITFIHKGKVVLTENKDDLLSEYCVVKCSNEELSSIPKENIVGKRIYKFGAEVLMKRENVPHGAVADSANLEDIMLFYIRGEKE